MTTYDEKLLDEILDVREGPKFTDRPEDRGGPTRWGITQDTLSAWRGHAVTKEDVALLTREEARAIYRTRYVLKPGFADVRDDLLRGLLVDCGVLHGPLNAVKLLQRALGVADDGEFGPVTRAALEARPARRLFAEVMAQRLSFLGRLVTKDLTDNDRDGIPDAAENDWGWMNRQADLLREFAREVA